MHYIQSKIKQLWLNDSVRRVFHTFWQAAGGVLLSGLLLARSSNDVKLAVGAAFAAGLAAVKALYQSQKEEPNA